MAASAPAPAPAIGCAAMFAATALAALLVMLGISPPLTVSIEVYVLVFIVTSFIVGVLGAPLYWLARHFDRANVWTAMASGFLTGAAFPALSMFGEHLAKAWVGALAYGMVGAAGGLSFFLIATAPAAPLRNAAALFGLVAVSIVATVLIRPYLM